jgi:hypothetical protein
LQKRKPCLVAEAVHGKKPGLEGRKKYAMERRSSVLAVENWHREKDLAREEKPTQDVGGEDSKEGLSALQPSLAFDRRLHLPWVEKGYWTIGEHSFSLCTVWKRQVQSTYLFPVHPFPVRRCH